MFQFISIRKFLDIKRIRFDEISKFQESYSLEIENVSLGEENVQFKLPKEVRN